MITHLRTLLRSQGLAVGERVYADTIPAKADLPCIVLKRDGTNKMQTLDGIGGLQAADVDLYCLSLKSREEADDIADAVESFLNDYEGAMGDLTFEAAIFNDRDDEYIDPDDGSDSGVLSSRIRATIQFSDE